LAGNPASYDLEDAVDTEQFFAFLLKTQPDEHSKLGISDYKDKTGKAQQKFLARFQGEITRRGGIDVLRHAHKPIAFLPHPLLGSIRTRISTEQF